MIFKRGLAAVIAAVLFGSLFAVFAQSKVALADETAAELTDSAVISSQKDPEGLANLTDKNISSRYFCAAGTDVTIETEEKVSQLYMVIDKPVSGYKVSSGGITKEYGKNGFLHEYILLEAPSDKIEITFTAEKTVVCEIYLFSDGETPDWVQKWQPPYEDADMLVLPTHADDEHLWFGGTMPYYGGELGYKVQVAYMTNHWGERYRPHELLNGLWKVGITAYPVISDFPDAYVDNLANAEAFYKRDKIMEWQIMLLRRFKPEVVVAHDLDGEYGHGAHILNASTILEAAPLSADETVYPELAAEYGLWQLPKLYLHLYPENAVVMDWRVPLENFGGKTALEMAAEGYAEHLSQQQYWFEVKDAGKYNCSKFGLAYTTVGADAAETPDFFENIAAFSDEKEEAAESSGESERESSVDDTSAESSAESEAEESSVQSSREESISESSSEAENEDQPKEEGNRKGLNTVIIIGVAAVVAAAVVIQLRKDSSKV
ncbi:MAG: PIG-L family deacetylase [Oscillospiraceae bacterium]|nr:PIG-L family deacetylase [Oscillospiraceae bacterium]